MNENYSDVNKKRPDSTEEWEHYIENELEQLNVNILHWYRTGEIEKIQQEVYRVTHHIQCVLGQLTSNSYADGIRDAYSDMERNS